jgi:hypothetical protein|tara:strand:+ start:435 stop:725 length:291 start_codon:yes stop_codon:yes gene_type:complete
MFVEAGRTGAFKVDVEATSNGGHPPEFWAKRCSERLLAVAESAPPVLREQAQAFKDQIEHVVLLHMKRAIQSDRSTVGHLLTEAGQPKLAELVRRV